MKYYYISHILFLTSYFIIYRIFVAMIVIFKQFDEVVYIWFCSKILTIKNILKNNHNENLFYIIE